jgi:accessory colonization factor AcfC
MKYVAETITSASMTDVQNIVKNGTIILVKNGNPFSIDLEDVEFTKEEMKQILRKAKIKRILNIK